MHYHKILAILFTLLSFGAISEAIRIITSSAPDIAENRKELIPMSVNLTAAFCFLAILFWRKASRSNKRRL